MTVAGVAINTMTAGLFIGQRLIITNRDNSSAAFNINANSGGWLAMGTAFSVAVGRACALYWDGAVWRAG